MKQNFLTLFLAVAMLGVIVSSQNPIIVFCGLSGTTPDDFTRIYRTPFCVRDSVCRETDFEGGCMACYTSWCTTQEYPP